MLLYITVCYCMLLYINININPELELDFISLEQIYDLGSPVTLLLDIKLSHQIINFSLKLKFLLIFSSDFQKKKKLQT